MKQLLRKILSRTMIGLATLLFYQSSFAIPAYPGVITEHQPDDSSIELRFLGDKNQHWTEDLNGYTVININGRYEYAKPSSTGGKLISTGLIVGQDNPSKENITKHLTPLPSRTSIQQNIMPNRTTVASGTIKNLVVMIRFSNHTNRALPSKENINVLFNAIDGDSTLAPTGSVRDFYSENSYGQMTLDSTVSDWITVSNTEAYYANGQSGDSTLWQALQEALTILDQSIDFSEYDADNDGFIDSITFIHSGYGAEWGGTDTDGTHYSDRIWSHRWNIQPQWTSAEDVSVSAYHISPSLWQTSGQNIGRIGVIVHETGHFFGLPDLYDTDGNGSGIGSYGTMANSWGFDGSQYYPPNFSPWSKIKLGWITPTTISQNGQYSLEQSESTPSIFKIDNGFPNGEYLLVENRQASGFDSKIPQGGLAIWHIDDTTGYNTQGYPGQSNWPQNGKHYRVSLLQADGKYNLERNNNRGDSGDLFHAGAVDHIDTGASLSHPNTDSYKGGTIINTGNSLINISATSSAMTFCLNTCSGSHTNPEITTPSPESVLTGDTEFFSWKHNNANVKRWTLWIGSKLGQKDIFKKSFHKSKTSYSVSNLPTDGNLIYVRLRYKIDSKWSSLDYTYTAFNNGGSTGDPELETPADGTILNGSSQTFSWTNNNHDVKRWILLVGKKHGKGNIYRSRFNQGVLSHTVENLPTDGSTIYVRLRYKLNNQWHNLDHTFTASSEDEG